MDEQGPLEFKQWARRYRGMAGVAIPDTPEGNRALFKLREDYGTYVSGFDPAKPPVITGGSFTNAEGRVTDYIVKPKGADVQVLEPKVLVTPGGTYTMKSATNAVPVTLPDGSIAQNYTSDPFAGAPAPGIGGAGMAVTNAPTAAPVQTPAPSPTPAALREGMRVRQNGITYVITNGVPVPVTGP